LPSLIAMVRCNTNQFEFKMFKCANHVTLLIEFEEDLIFILKVILSE
jgi:hypothetical protein